MFVKKFLEKYEEKLGRESAEKIIEKSNKILQSTLIDGKPSGEVGLIVGKVQSGKTSNFLGLIANAFNTDAYDVVFLIGGVDSVLLEQNYNRVSEVFSDVTDSDDRKVCRLYKSEDIIKKNTDWVQMNKVHFKDNANKKIIITILKEINHLKSLNKLIKDESLLFANKRVLIIDDEGDQGSLDGNLNTKMDYKTKWNESIIELTKKLKSFAYLTVTATPYANLLIEQSELLSPSFIEVTYPGEGYCGLEEFHNKKENNNRKYLKIIKEEEVENYYDCKRLNIEFQDISSSLEKALSYFLCATIEMQNLGINLNDYEMLVNPCLKMDCHKIFCNKIKKKLNEIIEIANDLRNDPNNIYKKIYFDFINLGFNMVYSRDIDENNENDKKFIKSFLNVIEETECIIINSVNDKFGDTQNKKYRIYVGSNLLSRGVTLQNLIVTFITRSAKGKNQADTLLQRARWFGYRDKILDYMKIFTSKRLADEYYEIFILENDLWEKLERIDAKQLTVDEFMENIFLSLDETIKPTRPNVAKYRTTNVSSWVNQNSFFDTKETENTFYEKVENENTTLALGTRKFIYKDYKNLLEFAKETNILNFIFEKINIDSAKEKIYEQFKNYKTRVILMKPETKTEAFRSLSQNNKFTIHASGSKTKVDFSNESIYFGDSKIDYYKTNKDMILIQIYNFNFNFYNGEKVEDTKAYAIYFPNKTIKGVTRG